MKNKGFTAIEIVVVLAVIMILASVLSVVLVRYVEDAKVEKAQKDVESIWVVIFTFNLDSGLLPRSNGSDKHDQSFDVVFFGSSKNLPKDNVPNEWRVEDIKDETDPEKRDVLNCHFLKNDPNRNNVQGDEDDYPSAGKKIWQGPYFDTPRHDQDPWGRAYMVSFFGDPLTKRTRAKIVSAGPNGILETRPFSFVLDPIPSLEGVVDDIVKIY